MALRRFFGFSDGELMRSDAKPCSRLMRQTGGIVTVGGALGFSVICITVLARITTPRARRWSACGAVTVSFLAHIYLFAFSVLNVNLRI